MVIGDTLYRDMDRENRCKADNYLIVTHGIVHSMSLHVPLILYYVWYVV
jgi:hypothetical protein